MAMRDAGKRNEGFLDFPIVFDDPGCYYIYMLMRRTHIEHLDKANDAFVSLAGRRVYASDDITRPDGIRCSEMSFTWQSMPKGPGAHTPRHIIRDPIYVKVTTPGTYTLRIGSHSPGFELDKMILSSKKELPLNLGAVETIRKCLE